MAHSPQYGIPTRTKLHAIDFCCAVVKVCRGTYALYMYIAVMWGACCTHHDALFALNWLRMVSLWRGVGNERNLIHLVEKSVEIKLKSWQIKADFLEIKLGNQPNPPAPPTFTTYDVIFEGNHAEIKEKSGNLVHQNCSLPTPRRPHIYKTVTLGQVCEELLRLGTYGIGKVVMTTEVSK